MEHKHHPILPKIHLLGLYRINARIQNLSVKKLCQHGNEGESERIANKF